jgi:hypothetical protein
MRRLAAFACLATLAFACSADPLGPYNVDPAQTTVSGISSGGAMAVQMHVAYSGTFRGAAVIAGAAYYCAYGSIAIATGVCSQALAASEINVPDLVRITRDWAGRGWVDDTANLASTKIYLFSGTLDQTMRQGTMDALRDYYLNFTSASNIVYNNSVAAGHGWISPLGSVACALQAKPFINNCMIDPEQVFLSMFYGPLQAKQTGMLTGAFTSYDQTEFVDDRNPAAHSLSTTGWMYVPAACQRGEECRLHVAFHGCNMTYTSIADAFIRTSGLNEWADTNRIVVLYPQALENNLEGNPYGCWDWMGFDSPDYAKKNGPHMLMTKRMVDRVTSGHAPVAAPANVTATLLGNSVRVNWSAVSGASGYRVYRDGVEVTSNITTALTYTDRTVAPRTSYVYTVRAMAANGNMGPASAGAAVTTR